MADIIFLDQYSHNLWSGDDCVFTAIPSIKRDRLTTIKARYIFVCDTYVEYASTDEMIQIVANEKRELDILILYLKSDVSGAAWYSLGNFSFKSIELYQKAPHKWTDELGNSHSAPDRMFAVLEHKSGFWQVMELAKIQFTLLDYPNMFFSQLTFYESSKEFAIKSADLDLSQCEKVFPCYQRKDKQGHVRYTPSTIQDLEDDEIFVFGSNPQGNHNGASAKIATNKFGAIQGQGKGPQGQSYAIPTTTGGIKSIQKHVDEFIEYAHSNQQQTFLVTKIGCGNAGYSVKDIAPLFRWALPEPNIILPKEFVEELLK